MDITGRQMAAMRAQQPIIDAHHHVWDLSLGKHPWLIGEPLIPFRYGDYRGIRQTYMPADFRRDAENFKLVKSVYVETEWDPSDPIGETRWVHAIARTRWPAQCGGGPGLARSRRCRGGFSGASGLPSRAQHSPQAEVRAAARRMPSGARRVRWMIPAGAPAMRCWNAMRSTSTCRRRGGTSMRPPPWRAISPRSDHRQSHGIAGGPDAGRVGRMAARARGLGGSPERGAEDFRHRCPAHALDGRRQ